MNTSVQNFEMYLLIDGNTSLREARYQRAINIRIRDAILRWKLDVERIKMVDE